MTTSATVAPPRLQPSSATSWQIEQELVRWVTKHRIGITIIQIAGLFISTAAAGILGSLGLVDRWNENRNRAELLRREVFNEVLKLAQEMAPKTPEVPDPGNPVRQAFEFFRRYQLELQIGYYAKGGAHAERSAAVLTWLTATLAAVAAVTGVIGTLGGTPLIISAFLGIAVPIVLSAAQSWRATSRDSDKAAGYAKARAALQGILLDLGGVRKKADLADAAAVRAYIDSVHLVMTTENEAWVPARRP